MNKKEKRMVKNTTMLLILNITKLVFPFVTLPYLARVLSTDGYGSVAYIKAVMSYMQVIIDFGFMLSATKRIVEVKDDKKEIGRIVGTNILAKLMLAFVAGIGLLALTIFIPILKANILYTFLSYQVVVLTIFLFDFLFRGIEQMQIITVRFLIMKSTATLCTFIFVKSDADILMIPIFDLISSILGIIWVAAEFRKLNLKIQFTGIRDSVDSIRESAVYFMSNMASTSFNVFNTFILGIALTSTEVAYWSVCMQIINAIQALYIPISDGIYPEMIRSKDISIIKRVVHIFGPVVSVGSIVAFAGAKLGLYIIGGSKYVDAYVTFRLLIPVIFFGFFAVIYGWPTLGAIGKTKETTRSTVFSAIFQIMFVLVLFRAGRLTLVKLALARSLTEMIMFGIRYYYFRKNINLFNKLT